MPCSLPSRNTTKVLKNSKTFSSRPRPRPNVRDQDFMMQDQDFHFCPRGAYHGLHHCNRPTQNTQTNPQTGLITNLQYTAPLSLARSVKIYVDDQQVSQFRYLGISEDGYCTKEIRIRIEMTKKVLMEKKKLFAGKMNLELKKRVLVWSVTLYAAETWTMTGTDRSRL